MKQWKIDLKCTDEEEALKMIKWLCDAFHIANATKLPMDFMSAEIGKSKIECIKTKIT